MQTEPAHSVPSDGFTLVELAIVLVIVGLLVGGVLVGRDLIHQAELRSVLNRFTAYHAAVHTFQNKYNGLPGDLKNATTFWGSAGGDGSDITCRNTNSTGSVATCNGDGNGMIDGQATEDMIEGHRAWQQLANAGLIGARVSGKPATPATTPWALDATNAPSGPYQKGIWSLMYYSPASGSAQFFRGTYGHSMVYGLTHTGYGPDNPLFSGEDLWNMDVKADDGKPATGRIVIIAPSATGPSACTDTTSTSNMDAQYLTQQVAPSCAIIFRNLF